MNAIYLGLTGASARERQVEVVANNLANVSTTGFKGDRVRFESVLLAQEGAAGVKVAATVPDLTDGSMIATGRALDVALAGDGLMAVHGAAGERFVRGGSLLIDADGKLALSTGEVVIAETGRTLQVGRGNEERVGFTGDGEVLVDGTSVGRLRLRTFANPEALVREGAGRFRAPPEAGAQNGPVQVHGATLERANSDVTRGLVEMIRLQRAYEVQLEAMRQRDGITHTTIEEVGQIGR
jgi:flagellar basal-body rod protein FlgF